MSSYARRVIEDLRRTVPWEREFLQAAEEVLTSIAPSLERNPRYEANRVLERMVEPERVAAFRVVWADDAGVTRVNRGFRIGFSSALGPYKGGLRFHSSVSLSSLKFLGFEQTFKNSLTGLPLGGGKGGSDFHPRGKSDREVMAFCQSFMNELARHIGPNTDVPAGDIGVGARELGYLFGQYRRLRGSLNGAITGKGLAWGGSLMRPEATGFGVVYFVSELLRERGEDLAGKRVVVSGFGNVAWGVVTKMAQLGATVVTISGPDGFIFDPKGVCGEKIQFMLEMRASGHDQVLDYATKFGVEFHAGKRPWGVPCDVAIPCAIQNELDEDDARRLLDTGCRLVVEGANMPSTPQAIALLATSGAVFVPGKASNAGGVIVSGLEMAQNASFASWTRQELDGILFRTIAGIQERCARAAEEYGAPGNYLVGANIAGFEKVADAVIEQGLV